jgi:hypothetical protein
MDTSAIAVGAIRCYRARARALRESPRSSDLGANGSCLKSLGRQPLSSGRNPPLRPGPERPTGRWQTLFLALALGCLLPGCQLFGPDAPVEARAEAPTTGASPDTNKVLARRIVSSPTRAPAISAPVAPPSSRSVPPELVLKRPATTVSKGAEKLLPQSSSAPIGADAPKPASLADDNVLASDTPPNALVFKGPSRPFPARVSPKRNWFWLCFVLGAATAGVGGVTYYKRTHPGPVKPSKSKDDDLIMPKDFLMKEPAHIPRDRS